MSTTHVPADLRRLVYQRAKSCCEFCLVPEAAVLVSHEIDHIITEKHGGSTDAGNLALSCTICNKHKGSDLASLDTETGMIVPLFHPRKDRWFKHFRMDDTRIIPLTPTGRVTVKLLQLNHPDRVEEREYLIAAGMFNLYGKEK